MTHESILLYLVLWVGLTIILAILIKAGLGRVGVPDLVGYLCLGFILQGVDMTGFLSTPAVREVYGFLAELGIISLLFRVGLESNLEGLIRQLPNASLILVGDLLWSGFLGFVASYYWLNLSLISSLFICIALTATSAGISVGVWQEKQALQSRNGELLLDVAEMDDMAAIAAISLLLAMVPILNGEAVGNFLPVLGKTIGPFALKVSIFGTSCMVFSRYIERHLTRFFERIEPSPDPMLMVAAIGFIIAALAGLLGFSVAVGAFFAGLVFSRDPEAVKFDASFDTLAEFFIPFFFINIGLQLQYQAFATSINIGGILVIVAILGKVLGIIGPAILTVGWQSSTLLGLSMIPRGEITMVIMQQGLDLGEWAVPPDIFAAMIFVSIVTSVIAPLLLHPLLQRWPQIQEDQQ